MISTTFLAELTDIDESAMSENFTVTASVRASDSGGAYTETTTTATVAGYLWSVTGDEAGADQVKARGTHRIAVPKTTVVSATARITQQSTGRIFEVVYPFPVTAYSTSLIVGVKDR